MSVKVKAQGDYLLTEVSIDLPCDLNDLDYLMRTSHGTGKIVAVYTQGNLSGVNVEQKTRIRGAAADRVRDLVGVQTTEVNGYHK